MASIIVASGPSEGDYYPLAETTVVVGRDAKCPIQIVDERISRVHMQVRFDKREQAHFAEDLRSANGVFLNGRPLSGESRLTNGDLMELGGTKLMYFTRDFPDRSSAWDFYKIAGERAKGTLIQSPDP